MVRRVVTGADGTGAAVFVSDGEPPRTGTSRFLAGSGQSVIWATEAPPRAADGDPTAALSSVVPGPGETVAMTVTFPPAAAFADPSLDWAGLAAEQLESVPGLAELFEPDAPGMHTTPTVDYVVVLTGSLDLTLDNGVSTSLEPGDIVVQNATRHAWSNPHDTPASIFVVLMGRAKV